jgi:hypothetical protein
MKTVQIKRDELLAKLRENRAKHITDFNASREKFYEKRTAAIRELAQADRDNTNRDILAVKRITPLVAKLAAMPTPTSYENSYNRAIAMLEREQREVIEITDAEFAQYYLDDWQWRGQYAATTAMYNS